ncbi:MAG: M15 family metallopeptidase [Actinomycetota bacterium]|nr:M15 family metallopeptidase [Actinomycetota bacterium]
MPTFVNGRALGVAANGLFNSRNTDPIPGGRLWPEAAATWRVMRAGAIRDGIPASYFMPAGSRSSARGRRAQDHFWANQPPTAARPYSSNHGWGIAVDVKTRSAAAWIMANGHRFGWSWDEGRRVGEWWHFRYVGLPAARLKQIMRDADPLRVLTKTERHLADRLRYHRRRMAEEARTGKGPNYRAHRAHVVDYKREIEHEMRQMRKAARLPRFRGGGWDRRHRGARYQLCKKLLERKL